MSHTRRRRKIIKNILEADNSNDYMKNLPFDWQTPVITEKTFYLQNKYDDEYLGIAWAEIIDRKINHRIIINKKATYTCCQHISFRKLIPVWKKLNIKTVYTPHKKIGEDVIDGINIKACPLYAVNVEDNNRNQLLVNKDYLNYERKLWYSFQGNYQKFYMSDIRKKIASIPNKENNYINIKNRWHFEDMVYGKDKDTNKKDTLDYNQLLLDSRFSLCPSGSGPNSIRLWECLAVGSIPVLLSDELDLPPHDLWSDSIVRIAEKDIGKLEEILQSISPEKEREMRKNGMQIYNYFKHNYKGENNIVYTLFTSYLCDEKDPYIQKILNKWKILNPNFNILYFSDNDVNKFFKNTPYFDIYKQMKNGVAIADFFRICYINKYGGFWFDIDIEPFAVNIEINHPVQLFDCGYGNISYMFIGGKSNQKLFKKIIENVVENIKGNIPVKKEHIMSITGPSIIQNIIFKDLNIISRDKFFKAPKNSKIFLKGGDNEFCYTSINLKNIKTEDYKNLQKKYKKLNYQKYNFI